MLYIEQDVNFMWQSRLGLGKRKMSMKVCEKWTINFFKIRMEWVKATCYKYGGGKLLVVLVTSRLNGAHCGLYWD